MNRNYTDVIEISKRSADKSQAECCFCLPAFYDAN